VKRSFLAIHIYYNEFKYTRINEEHKTEYSVVSNIGGILSLFLGISFLSCFEIFEIFFEIIFYFFFKFKKPINVIE